MRIEKHSLSFLARGAALPAVLVATLAAGCAGDTAEPNGSIPSSSSASDEDELRSPQVPPSVDPNGLPAGPSQRAARDEGDAPGRGDAGPTASGDAGPGRPAR